MRLKAVIQLLGKVNDSFEGSDGKIHPFWKANIMQNSGEIIDTIRLTQEQFNKVESGKTYTITADYGVGKNGGYLRLIDVTENAK